MKYLTRLSIPLGLACAIAASAQQPPPDTQAYAPAGTTQTRSYRYTPATTKDRFDWFLLNTTGPASIAGGLISAGWGTAFNSPKEYGTHWAGFGKRDGMRLTGVATSNAMEAGIGQLWGEDPRYFREPDQPFRHRVLHVLKMTVLARNREGTEVPAYARYAAISGSSFLSNTWRPDSQATTNQAVVRIGLGFIGRMSSDAFYEFWPDVQRKIKRAIHGDRTSGTADRSMRP